MILHGKCGQPLPQIGDAAYTKGELTYITSRNDNGVFIEFLCRNGGVIVAMREEGE